MPGLPADSPHALALKAVMPLLHSTGGLKAAQRLAKLTDRTVKALAKQHLHPALCVIATGGYGAGHLAPFSDVDILILQPTQEVTDGITPFVNALWDSGYRLSQSVHTPDSLLALIDEDHTALTSLMTARPLWGDRHMADELMACVRTHMGDKARRTAFIEAKLAERDERHEKAGAARFAVEPDVKSGPGGLRDLQTLYWIVSALAPEAKNPLPFVLDANERRLFARGQTFLWTVRFHMHLLTGRAQDRLTFDLQPRLAQAMGFGDGDNTGVQRLMHRYFWTTQQVRTLTRIVCTRLEDMNATPITGPITRLAPGISSHISHHGGRLRVAAKAFRDTAADMMGIFDLAAQHNLDIHPETLGAVARGVRRLKSQDRQDPDASARFLSLLARGPNAMRAIRLMHETGFLGWFLPEFRRITGLSQFDMHHAYTVDEHTLRALAILLEVEAGQHPDSHPLCTEAMQKIEDSHILKLAVLLHDVGKGTGDQLTAGARRARRAAKRLGLPPRDIKRIGWLVQHHLLMSEVAQKRDLADPSTVKDFAAIVKTPNRLRQLMVLTVMDMQAVGPQVWNSWKGSLMTQLYHNTEDHFRGKSQSSDTLPHPLVPGARLQTPTPTNSLHDATQVDIIAPDHGGLMASLTLVMARHGASVMAARIRTEGDMAVDSFWLQDRRGQAFGAKDPMGLDRLLAELNTLVTSIQDPQDEVDFTPIPPPPLSRRARAMAISPVVTFDDTASERALVIEVSGRDRPGLLSELAHGFSQHNLNILSAHIDKYGPRAVDVFYVQHEGTLPHMSMNARARLKADLLTILEPEDAAQLLDPTS